MKGRADHMDNHCGIIYYQKKITMKSKYSVIKKTIDVFQKHGIRNISRNRNRSLRSDYGLSTSYMAFILYDVEQELQVDLGENVLSELNNPGDYISLVLKKFTRSI